MEENKKEKLDKIDELLESTSAENRIHFNLTDTVREAAVAEDESVDILSGRADDDAENAEEKTAETVDVHSVENDDSDNNDAEAVCIIDETSTTIELTESTDLYGTQGRAAVKKPKEKVKFNALQIVFMCVVGLMLLWCIIFTVDHTLAAQGYSPIFSWETQKYEDGSVSYKGLGYKIQFRFDSNDNLTQKCVPIWKDGPNDIAEKQEPVSFDE